LGRVRTARDRGHVLKTYASGASTCTYRVELEGLGPVWLKEYRFSPVKRFFSLFRKSRGERVWRMSEHLLARGSPVARPLLLVEVRRFGFLRESFLVTEWLEGRENLVDWYRSWRDTGERREDAEAVILRVARAAAGFHRRGVIHGDMKWGNFLLPAGKNEDIILTDLDATRFGSAAAARGRDLAVFARTAIEEGMPAGFVEDIFEHYCEELNPPDPERIEVAYEGYLRKKFPGTIG